MITPLNEALKAAAIKAQDAAIRAEGEAMIAAIQKPSEPKAGLIDATGAPLGQPEQGSKVTLSQEALQQNAEYQLEQRRMRSAQKLEKIVQVDLQTARVRDVIYLAYQLLFWARMEMSTNDNVSDEMIQDCEFITQWSIYKNAKTFDFKKLVSRLKNFGVGALKEFQQRYTDRGRIQAMRLKTIKTVLGDKGIPTTAGIEALLGHPFTPGRMLILRGDAVSTQKALMFILKHFPAESGPVFQAHMDAGISNGPTIRALPRAWWHNAAQTTKKLDEIFNVVLSTQSLLLGIEDITHLFDMKVNLEEDSTLSAEERKAFAIKRMYQWASDNLVAVVLCDNTTEPVRGKPYGHIPYVQVIATGTHLNIGGESINTGELL